MANSSTAPAGAVKLQRQAAALELRRAGLDFRQISHQLGIGVGSAHRLVKAALAEQIKQIDAKTTELRAEELSRLDGLLTTLWPRKAELAVVDRLLRIMERRAKLLGLDAPVQHAVAGPHGGPIPVRHDGIDLDSLDDAELAQYETLVRAAAQRPRGGTGVGAPRA